MRTITITAKRQATFPASVCEELGLAPGMKIALERRVIAGQPVWALRGQGPDWSWVGSLRRYAKGKSHRVTDIRRSIQRGWASEGAVRL